MHLTKIRDLNEKNLIKNASVFENITNPKRLRQKVNKCLNGSIQIYPRDLIMQLSSEALSSTVFCFPEQKGDADGKEKLIHIDFSENYQTT